MASPTALVTSAPVRSEPGFTSSTYGGQATMLVLTLSDSLCWLRHAWALIRWRMTRMQECNS